MSQMVLPQTSPQANPQGNRADTGAKNSADSQGRSSDSRFDSVSRAEQQRLDSKQAERRDQARSDEKARNEQVRQEKAGEKRPDDRKEASAATESRKESRSSRESQTSSAAEEAAEKTAGNEGMETPLEQDNPEEAVQLTFAGLQALLTPANGQGVPIAGGTGIGLGGNGQVPGAQAFAELIAGLPGNPGGKPGQGTTQGQSQGGGLALTEALLSGVAGDGSRAQESPSVQGALRFQAAAELAGQQVANPNSAKLPAEAAALRGYTTSIDVPVNHAEWGDKLVGKLTWLTARNMSVAEIHLTPPDMGPMEVRVQVQQEQANITVHSANAAVRDRLELHSHRLRDMLSEQGLSLEQFDVSDSPQQQTGEEGSGAEDGNGSSNLADTDSGDQNLPPETLDLTWKGEVDIFA